MSIYYLDNKIVLYCFKPAEYFNSLLEKVILLIVWSPAFWHTNFSSKLLYSSVAFSCQFVPWVKWFINVIRYWDAVFACIQGYLGSPLYSKQKVWVHSQRGSAIRPASFACTQPQGDKLQRASLCAHFRPSKGWMLESVLCPLLSPLPPSSHKRYSGLLWVPPFQDTEFNHFGLSAYSSDGAFLESKEEGTRVMFALAAKEIELNSTWLID